MAYRNSRLCNLTNVTSFEELETGAGIPAVDVANLRRIYESIRDLDVFSVGAFRMQLVKYSEIDGKIMVIFAVRR